MQQPKIEHYVNRKLMREFKKLITVVCMVVFITVIILLGRLLWNSGLLR